MVERIHLRGIEPLVFVLLWLIRQSFWLEGKGFMVEMFYTKRKLHSSKPGRRI